MSKLPVSMELIPIWEAPHSFARGGENVAPGGERVFSFGLLISDLALVASDQGRARLAERWGELEVGHLRGLMEARTELPGLPPELHEIALQTTDVSERNRLLGGFVAAINAAADRSDEVPAGFEAEVKWFLDQVERPDRIEWKLRVGKGGELQRVRSAAYRDLRQRLAIEFDHLVTRRPLLRRCKLCGRAFVPLRPSRPEVHCRAHLWRQELGGSPVHLESCHPHDDETERVRTAKRLHQRFRRARERYGKTDARTKAALRAWNKFMTENPPARTRGRPPQPETTYQPNGESDA